jgi:hypothetical protein
MHDVCLVLAELDGDDGLEARAHRGEVVGDGCDAGRTQRHEGISSADWTGRQAPVPSARSRSRTTSAMSETASCRLRWPPGGYWAWRKSALD